jgi:hypothetical protein
MGRPGRGGRAVGEALSQRFLEGLEQSLLNLGGNVRVGLFDLVV